MIQLTFPKWILGAFLLLVYFPSKGQNIKDCLDIIDFKWEQYAKGDLIPSDTIVDLRNGYYAVVDDRWEEEAVKILVEAAIFKNADGTKLLAITAVEEDPVCQWHNSYFFEINRSARGFKKLEQATLFPGLNILQLLPDQSIVDTVQFYLPQLEEQFYERKVDEIEVLSQFYDIHFKIPRNGTTVVSSLTLCDFMPETVAEIIPDENALMIRDTRKIDFKYDRQQKQFVRKK